jgi:hypothetical protein
MFPTLGGKKERMKESGKKKEYRPSGKKRKEKKDFFLLCQRSR